MVTGYEYTRVITDTLLYVGGIFDMKYCGYLLGYICLCGIM